mmetsp:Transcript_74414/g.215683  ORF Transcript_74414/g.215683 Transcript_74414/m.215683 type:complete len:255 (-) Transcript_74414:1169-1933(-)
MPRSAAVRGPCSWCSTGVCRRGPETSSLPISAAALSASPQRLRTASHTGPRAVPRRRPAACSISRKSARRPASPRPRRSLAAALPGSRCSLRQRRLRSGCRSSNSHCSHYPLAGSGTWSQAPAGAASRYCPRTAPAAREAHPPTSRIRNANTHGCRGSCPRCMSSATYHGRSWTSWSRALCDTIIGKGIQSSFRARRVNIFLSSWMGRRSSELAVVSSASSRDTPTSASAPSFTTSRAPPPSRFAATMALRCGH